MTHHPAGGSDDLKSEDNRNARRFFIIGTVVLAMFNIARSMGLFGGIGAVVLLVTVIGLAVWVIRGGLTSSDLGIEREHAWSGSMAGAIAFGAVVLVIGIGAVIPATSGFFEDDRARISAADLVYKLAIPVLLLTVIPEELAFRGILLGAGTRAWGSRTAVIASSVLFGLWHIGPTLATMSGNDQAAEITSGSGGRALVVAANVLVTFIAGLLFCWLRFRSRSLVAPIIGHLATNGVTLIVAWLVVH